MTLNQAKSCGQLRRNYELVFQGVDINSVEEKFLYEIPDNDEIRKILCKVNEILSNDKLNNGEKQLMVMEELKNIKDKSISLQQSEEIVKILFSNDVFDIQKKNKILFLAVINCKRMAISKLIDAIKVKVSLTNDVEELKSLCGKIPYCVEQVSPIAVSSLKISIKSKISNIQRNQTMNNYENNFSNNILEIVKNISSDKIEISKINEYVNNEISNKNNKEKGNTQNQAKMQVFYKVTEALEKYAHDYPIQDPQKAIIALEKVFGMHFDSNFRTVIKNYIERKEYTEAKKLCDTYSRAIGDDTESSKAIERARVMIQKAEIGEIILKAIMSKATEEQQAEFTKILEEKLKTHRYSYSSIPLGRTKDKSRKITLADIWGDEKDFIR